MKLEKETLLVIAPHPDDEVLGCFGLIDKIKKNGGKVYVQILTLGGFSKLGSKPIKKELWKKEFLKSSEFLKIDGYDIAFYDDEIKHLDNIPQAELIDLLELRSKVSLSKIKPTIVAIPTIFSSHQDHVQTYKIAISALRAHPQESSPLPKMVLSYESPEYYFWSAYLEFGKFSPNFYLKMSKEQISKKVKAMKIYQSQIRKNQRDGEKITALANIRGSEIGVNFAESYHIHRMHV